MLTNFKKNQKGVAWRKKAILALAVIAAAIVLLVMVRANFAMYRKKQELNYQINSMQQKIAELKKSNEDLQQGIAEANNDSYIEKVAREELGLQKPGEKVISFVQADANGQAPSPPQQNFLQAWLGWIGGWFK